MWCVSFPPPSPVFDSPPSLPRNTPLSGRAFWLSKTTLLLFSSTLSPGITSWHTARCPRPREGPR